MKESPIFTRTHDLLFWLLQATRKFPRDQRFVLARRLQDQAFALQDALIAASLDSRVRAQHLLCADIQLTGLRKTLLLCHQMEILAPGPYRHVSEMTAEVGRLLGAWRKAA
ncbi:MAG: four helix bundle protein [Anaerolineales bacterium]|nr:four helix bundle protein [Anaerolineales bacterium]